MIMIWILFSVAIITAAMTMAALHSSKKHSKPHDENIDDRELGRKSSDLTEIVWWHCSTCGEVATVDSKRILCCYKNFHRVAKLSHWQPEPHPLVGDTHRSIDTMLMFTDNPGSEEQLDVISVICVVVNGSSMN